MTREESNLLLNQACNLIFQVELGLSKNSSDDLRREGYRIRIAIADLQNHIREWKEKTNISVDKVEVNG